METDVLLLYPPISPGLKPKYALPPLGILYIGTLLRRKNFKVMVIDAEKDGLTLTETVDRVTEKQPEILGISTMSLTYAATLRIAEMIKKMNSDIKIVLGGPHVTATLTETFEITKYVDYLVYGEGEYTFLELVEKLKENKSLNDVKGLIFRKENGKIKTNEPRDFITNLDGLPFPDLDLIENYRSGDYNTVYTTSKPIATIIASRGCPYNCSFCGVHLIHGRKTRFRSPENVVDEIEYRRDKDGVKFFIMKDSTLTTDREWVLSFCEEIERRSLKIKWCCNTRVDRVDEVLLKSMKNSGCELILFGVESGSEKILKNLRKGTTPSKVKEVFELVKKIGINADASFMIGNPGEDLNTINETIDMSKDIEPRFAKFFVTTALPGTDLYEESIKNNILCDPKWYQRGRTLNNESSLINPNEYGRLSFEDIDMNKMLKKCYKEFYFRRSYFFKTLRITCKNPDFSLHVLKSLPPLIKFVLKR